MGVSSHSPMALTESINDKLSLFLRRRVSVWYGAKELAHLAKQVIHFATSIVLAGFAIFLIGLMLGSFYAGFTLALHLIL